MQQLICLVYFGEVWKSNPSDGQNNPAMRVRYGVNVFREKGMQNEEMLKIKDVAALLKVGEKTIYSMAQSGELPAFKVRGQWRFSRKDIDEWIMKQKNTTHNLGVGHSQ